MFLVSCGTHRIASSFRVLPGQPQYILRTPDRTDVPFPIGSYSYVGPGWVDLRDAMELRIENAYFREGAPERTIANYVGTETITYRVSENGELRQLNLRSMPQRPADQLPVEKLLTAAGQHSRHHRFFYQVVMSRTSSASSALLLSAHSNKELEMLTKSLTADPDSICNPGSRNCTAFPIACSASLHMEIVTNGAPRTVLWGSTLVGVVPKSFADLRLLRFHNRRLVPVELDASDRNALSLPLLPGDHVTWQ
jgi:hypothetical protein